MCLHFHDHGPVIKLGDKQVITPHLSGKDTAKAASNLSFPGKLTNDGPEGLTEGSTKEHLGSFPSEEFDYFLEFDGGMAHLYRAPRTSIDEAQPLPKQTASSGLRATTT